MTIRFRIHLVRDKLAAWLSLSTLACGAVIGIEDGHPKIRPSAGGAGGVVVGGRAGMPSTGTGGLAGRGGGDTAGGGGSAGDGGSAGGAAGLAGGATGGNAGDGGGGAAGAASMGGIGGSVGDAGSGGTGTTGGTGGGTLASYAVPPASVKTRTLASTGDDPVAGLATTASSDLVVIGQLGGAMPIGADADLLPEPTGSTGYVLRYDAADALTLAARLHAQSLALQRVIAGPDGAIYVLGRAEGALSVLDVPPNEGEPPASPTAASIGPFVVRLEPTGKLGWVRRFDASPGQTLVLESLAASADDLFVAGSFDGTFAAQTPTGGASVTSAPAAGTDVLVARLVATSGVIDKLVHIGSAGADDHVQLVSATEGSGARLAFTCAGPFVAPAAGALPDCTGIATVAIDASLGVGSATIFSVSSPDQIVFARGRNAGFLLGARYAGTATLPPLPPLPTGPARFLVAQLDDDGRPTRARSLPETGIVALEVVAADFDGGLLLGGAGRGCLPGDAGGQVCSSPVNTRNGLVIRLSAELGLEWAVFQTAVGGAPAGIVKGIVLCPNGHLLGASSFDTSVTVLKQKVPWKGGTDGVVGRFFH